MAIAVRPATPGDHADFVRLFGELGVPDPAPSLEHFAQQILPRVVVACTEAGVVGYASWRVYGQTAHLVHLAVDPRARGSGVGRTLMEHVRAIARQASCTRWYLNVKRDNAPALRLYERAGMTVERESWALSITWDRAAALAVAPGTVAAPPQPEDDAACAIRFGFPIERLASLRERPAYALIALREAGELAGFAAFDPSFPGAYPFAVARPELAGALLAGCRTHALRDRFDFIRLTIENDAAVVALLRAAGAELVFELWQLGGPLG